MQATVLRRLAQAILVIVPVLVFSYSVPTGAENDQPMQISVVPDHLSLEEALGAQDLRE